MTTVQDHKTELWCNGCGAHSNVTVRPDLNNMELCATCSGNQAKWHDATAHLQASLEPVIKAWREHWMAAGLDAQIVTDLKNDVLEGL
jgi:hypothetical protein